ncbi:glutamate 5-kinase [bacterium (Candidatus Blackallbacteria) CG17_big_fil_post_rev_8_21_14_2_50_48_46]|uniref:Glutamate 5-kinase n=1 Tax=bacterium (Candidatus Blackallbacteria) CG17_big_fil_post_rev_8_21_14_2_50_48_46 TaxID=2014261 RepID=A0A2M7GB97_9BACT|nr:MAG: glutamate 5-kinase [bacterium (Candidatus Blackallbacteria) CG18_big_fil_WC_8_21_14_2_50_49_26]PIW19455.1 MAG: glutamate 5-kinase [bacterium (Candidatus Blackallbacteria) CG17_big_fil_post_rev_8_21_14_2_50_48_46]PIW48941.1 MAG: glutamate 5-kinase [bacterium (Candidatus Blackallbacteria) CG13_big_fil_rev_8_21_14_2_50_49_14]
MKPLRIVVKLGTSVLTGGQDRLCRPRMVDLLRQIAALREAGHAVVLVSSGAVLAGWEQLGFPARKRTLAEKQLLAAVGQSQLMHLYAQMAEIYGIKVAQTLLTRDDFRDRRRYLNARTTFWGCLEKGVLPIVNENDVVAIEEIKVGDNDNLAAQVASLVEADLLLICTDCEGLFTADPRTHAEAELIPEVAQITDQIWALAGGVGSHRGTGGMQTKIQAAEIATRSGVAVRIVLGDAPDILLRAVQGEAVGTLFQPHAERLEARKRWILSETATASHLSVDAGAAKALLASGKSLLAAGVTAVSGSFSRGQTVRIFASDGREIARGLSRYDAADLSLIQGCRSDKIEAVLGYSHGAEVVHRDDLVVLGFGPGNITGQILD